jgi:hypothetical protein
MQLRRVLLTAHQVTVDAGYAATPFAVRQMVQHAIQAGPQQVAWDIAQEMWEDGRLDTPTFATSFAVTEAGNASGSEDGSPTAAGSDGCDGMGSCRRGM